MATLARRAFAASSRTMYFRRVIPTCLQESYLTPVSALAGMGYIPRSSFSMQEAAAAHIPSEMEKEAVVAAKSLSEASLGAKPDDNKGEIKDAKLIFDSVWRNLIAKYGIENLVFPREIVFLSGAPGAGKGTMNGFIMKERDIPITMEVSSLLQTAEMRKLKEAGVLIGDKEVMSAVVEDLIKPKCRNGVIVDGFPRTVVQAECIKLLHDAVLDLWQQSRTHPVLKNVIKRPQFSICVLYVDEDESVRRQLKRGKELAKLNQMVSDTGVGLPHEVRATDLSEEAARKRYRIFKDEVYAALQSIKNAFHFHFIPADGGPEEVKHRILHEFAYQSSLDLHAETYEMVRNVDPASNIIRSARSNMVSRLNSYVSDHRGLFQQAIDLINNEFMHIIKRQALAGTAIIRSNNTIFENAIAINMVLDLLAERGFSVTLDIVRAQIPSHLEPAEAGDDVIQKIICRVEKSFIFRIEFPKPEIRRND